MESPKQIVEKIRKIRFGMGLDTANLTEEQRVAIEDKRKILSDASKLAREIHTRNPHFIFELIQNAEDNEYENPMPTLRFIVDSDYLIIQNNERGFEEENVWALCGIGETTKTKALGYIGEKGIGFKSVFMVADKVRIYSNGFQFGFNYDESNPITMIIPEWIDEIPSFVDLEQTNIVLHLKPEIRNEINAYLEEIHPSLLLFLRKLKVIEVKKDREKVRKMELHERNGIVEIVYDDKRSYYKVIKKLFNVPKNIDEERRKDVNETEIILAFPLKEDYSPNTSDEQFVFAFLPVRNYGFKFIIQADFLLPVTREDIIKDNKWNEWLRDSIAEVFLHAVTEFKKDEKLRYGFYNYLSLEEVRDEFFLPLVDQIYEKLGEEECILTEANKWKKPSEVLIGDEEIKKIIKNEDLQKFFGKEYLSEKIKAKKPILHKLGVRDFSVDELIKCLENTEWIKKQNEEWFACLFRYLSKKKLSDEQLKRLEGLEIIKLENGEFTSINESVVFFPLEKKEIYGFEGELRVIKKGIVDIISKYEKEERENILEFLKKLGLKHTNPYEIIENHILPVYENGEWKQKDSKVLVGYIRYIKDNIDKYEEESDRRLNASKYSWEPKEDPLKRLKKSLLVRIDKDTDGKSWYAYPENIYLPKIYGNENNLEKLFEGIDVNFVHPCYIEGELESLDREINELENKLKGKSKRWKKKHRREVREIERRLKEIKERKEKVIAEWKSFFERIGVNVFLRVKKDPETENPSYWYVGPVTRKYVSPWEKKNTLWKDEEWVDAYEGYYIGDDWICNDFKKIIENIEKCNKTKKLEISKILFRGFERNWEKYEKYLKCHYYYRFFGQSQPAWSKRDTKSTFLLTLQNLPWVPTTKGLYKPREVFLDTKENREVLGDTVPYLTVKIENEDFIKTLGINTRANVEGVLNYLKSLVEQKSHDKEKFEKLYEFLDEHFEEGSAKIKEEFDENSLIFVPSTEKNYYRSKEVIWKDVSRIFGKNRIYLEKFYPKELKKFFVEKLGISEKPTPKDYADVLCSISEKTEISDEDKKVIVRIYEELNRNLNPDKVENPISEEDWWEDFTQKSIFLTDRDEFWSNNGDIFISDNNELYELFKDEESLGFLWLPEGYHPDKIKFFIKACKLRYLSESVEIKPLVEEAEYSKDEKLTQRIRSVIPYVLQYLYWKEIEIYEKIKKNGVIEKIAAIEVYAVDNLKVEYSVKVNERIVSKEAERRCIYHNSSLYLKKEDSNIYDLAIEFAKAFGEIKGLDDFVMNIMNNLSNAEIIMRAKNIGELPEKEREVLKEIYETGIKRLTEMEIQTKEEEEFVSEEKKEELEEEYTEEEYPEKEYKKEYDEEEHPEKEVTEIEKDVFDGIKEWVPEIPAKKVHIRTEEYTPSRVDENKTSAGKVPSTGTSKSKDIPQPSEKIRKDIGREGEKYALYCIIRDKLVERLNIEIGEATTFEDILNRYADIVKETDKGFNIEKDGNVIVEVIWLNKNGESGEHYDIKIKEGKKEIFVEVKSTKDYKKAWFEVSKDQWRLMKEKGDRFYIYRVYGAGTDKAKVEKIRNPAKLWKEGKIDADPIRIEL